MGDLLGSENMNDTCGKVMCTGTMNIGFTAINCDGYELEVYNFHAMISNF